MQITLKAENQDKTYSLNFISGRALRKTIEMQKKFKANALDEIALDTMVDYVVDLFQNQFTRDEFYDGIAANKIIDTIIGCINSVIGQTSNAMGTDPASPNV
jgi:hypothetical protein